MSLPGFQAEASLSSDSIFKTLSLPQHDDFAESRVLPQSLRNYLQNCEQLCEGDIVGACRPWCVCRCRGGKNCGVPS
jgi:hypothetical protein